MSVGRRLKELEQRANALTPGGAKCPSPAEPSECPVFVAAPLRFAPIVPGEHHDGDAGPRRIHCPACGVVAGQLFPITLDGGHVANLEGTS